MKTSVKVVNVSDETHRIVDIELPGTEREIVLEPGQSAEIPTDVWIRKMRCAWLRREANGDEQAK